MWEREDSANYMVVIGLLRGHGGAVLCLINERDLLFSGSADRTVRIWRRGMGNGHDCIGVLEGHERPVKSLGAVWEGEKGSFAVCSGSLDGEIKVWQIWGTDLNGSASPDHIR